MEHNNAGCKECHSQLQVAVEVDVSPQHQMPEVPHIIAPERYNFGVPIAITQDAAQGAGRQQAHARALIRTRMERHRDAQHVQFGAALNNTESLMSGQVVVPLFRLGERAPCTNCGALLFAHETSWGHLCCMKGQVVLPPIEEQLAISNMPAQDVRLQNETLKSIFELWRSQSRLGQTLRKYARQINNALAMASVTAASEVAPSHGSWKPSGTSSRMRCKLSV